MGIFDWLLGRADPSKAWAADPRLELEIDLSASSLCRTALGQGVEGLFRLGPPENPWPSREDVYRWHARGVEAQSTDGRLETIILFWNRDGGLPRPYAGNVYWRGKSLGLTAATRRAEIESVFGPPFHAQEDDDEPVLFYEHGDVEWQIEFAADGGLLEFMLTTPGLYADPEWRRKHGIAKPWPPAAGEGAPV